MGHTDVQYSEICLERPPHWPQVVFEDRFHCTGHLYVPCVLQIHHSMNTRILVMQIDSF